jgi:steroid 5-alpha reductase family enzyme
MLLLVRFVSGVPWNELQAMKSRPEDYARYRLETNTFVPWWPRALATTAAQQTPPRR